MKDYESGVNEAKKLVESIIFGHLKSVFSVSDFHGRNRVSNEIGGTFVTVLVSDFDKWYDDGVISVKVDGERTATPCRIKYKKGSLVNGVTSKNLEAVERAVNKSIKILAERHRAIDESQRRWREKEEYQMEINSAAGGLKRVHVTASGRQDAEIRIFTSGLSAEKVAMLARRIAEVLDEIE